MNVYEQECDSQELEYWYDEDDYEILDGQWKEKYYKSQLELKALQDKMGMIKNIVEGLPNYHIPFMDQRQAAIQRLGSYQQYPEHYAGNNLWSSIFGGTF